MSSSRKSQDAVAALLKVLRDVPEALDELRRLLGVPAARLDQKVDALESAIETLAAAQARTEATVRELAVEVKELAVAQARTDAAVRELAVEVKELSAAVHELAAAQARTDRAVGALSDNVGFGLEDLAGIVVPDVLLRKERIEGLTFRRRFVLTEAGEVEIDLYSEGTRAGSPVTVVGEVKSRIYPREVEGFSRKLASLAPALAAPVVPFLFGFVVHPSARPVAERLGIHVVASRPGE